MKLICARCGEEKDQRAFDRDASRASGRYPWCKLCRKKRKPGKIQSLEADLNGHVCPLCDTPVRGHPNRRFCSEYCKDRVSSLRRQYGLTVEQYRSLLPSDGLCPICGDRVKKWVVEHNHWTGEITGVCCTRCNVGLLAYSNHDSAVALRLYEYLKNPPAESVIGKHVVPDDPDGKLRGKSKLDKKWGR